MDRSSFHNISFSRNTVTLLCGMLLMGMAFQGKTQDFHLSQYDASPVILNPATTGMFNQGPYRSVAQFRTQWGALANKPFTTASLAFDKPMKKNRWGLGGYLVNHEAPRIFNTFSFVFSGAYQVMDPSQEEQKLSVGLQAGGIYKSTKKTDLTFDNQYSSGVFNNNLPSGENFEHQSTLLPEVNLGVQYKEADKEKFLNPRGGFNIMHITSPDESFLPNQESRLPRKFVVHAGADVRVSESFILDPKALFMKQGQATEMQFGLTGNHIMGDEGATELYLGGSLRLADAMVFLGGVDYKNLRFLMSYDMNTSGLQQYTSGNGGWEFSVRYFPDQVFRE